MAPPVNRATAGGGSAGLQRRGPWDSRIRGLEAGVQGWLLRLLNAPVGNVLGETGAPRAFGPPLIAHFHLLDSARRGVSGIRRLHPRRLC